MAGDRRVAAGNKCSHSSRKEGDMKAHYESRFSNCINSPPEKDLHVSRSRNESLN